MIDFETWKLFQHKTDFEVLNEIPQDSIKYRSKVWGKLPDVKVVEGIFASFKIGVTKSSQIAKRLGVTTQTVNRHRSLIACILKNLIPPSPESVGVFYVDLTKYGSEREHEYPQHIEIHLDEEHEITWAQQGAAFYYSCVYAEVCKKTNEKEDWYTTIAPAPQEILEALK